MTIDKKETTTKTKQKKELSRREKAILVGASVLLAIAIICVCVFAVYPKLAGKPDWQILGSLDFNNSAWIEDMSSNRIKPTGKALDIASSFVYSKDTAYITTQYASTTTVTEAKKYYLSQIPGSVDYKANEVALLNIQGKLNGEEYDIINYEADMFAAYDTKITIAKDKAQTIKDKLIKNFPADICKKIPEFAEIMKSEKLGGSVMYNDDELSTTSYAGIPIYSEAYRYSGTKDDLKAIEKTLADKYKETNSVLDEQNANIYIKDSGYIFSLSCQESDLNVLAVITVQKIPDKAAGK